MDIKILINFFFSLLNYAALVCLSFSIFRIPLKMNSKIITILTVSLGTFYFYSRFILNTPLFPLITLSVFIALLMILKRYPFFYSFVVCTIGFIVSVVIDMTVTYVAISLNLISIELILSSTFYYALFNAIVSVVALLLIIVLQHFKLGFSFIIKRFYVQNALKLYNFVWAAITVLAMFIIQFNVYNMHVNSIHFYILFASVLTILLILLLAYKQNKKMIRDRYGV